MHCLELVTTLSLYELIRIEAPAYILKKYGFDIIGKNNEHTSHCCNSLEFSLCHVYNF